MSRRMGKDKAMLDWNGVPLWQYQLDKLRALSPSQLLISCREDQPIDARDASLIIDPVMDQGPIPALQRCLQTTQHPLLVLAVDMPWMPTEFLLHILHLTRAPTRGIIFQSAHAFEPLCAIYPQSVLPLLARHQRLQTFAREAIAAGLLDTQTLTATQETYFLNVNIPADLHHASATDPSSCNPNPPPSPPPSSV